MSDFPLIGIVAAISFTVGVGVGAGGVYAAPFIGLRAAEKRATEAEGAAVGRSREALEKVEPALHDAAVRGGTILIIGVGG